MTTIKGIVGPNKKGQYHFKKTTPEILKKYIDKAELWILTGATEKEQIATKNNVDEAIKIANSKYPEDAKRQIINGLLGIEENTVKKVEKNKLSYVIQEFLDSKSNLSDEKLKDYSFNAKRILAITGDIKVESINYETIKEIKSRLMNMPNRVLGQYRDLSIENYANIKNVPANERLTITSINKNLTILKSILKFYQEEMNNPDFNIPTIKLLSDSENKKLKRLTFSDEQFEELLNGDEFENKVARVFGYTALRNSELMKAVLKEINGQLCLSLSISDLASDVKLKTDASYRIIPVHKSIENEINEVREYIAKYSEKAMSDRFNRWLREKGYSKKYTLYSLRHTFINILMNKDEVKDSVLKSLVGHTQANVTFGLYGKDFKVAPLTNAINMLK